MAPAPGFEELLLEMTFETRGSKPAAVDRHLERIAWLRKTIRLILGYFGLPLSSAKRWRVKLLIVVDQELMSPYIAGSSVPVWSFRELREKLNT